MINEMDIKTCKIFDCKKSTLRDCIKRHNTSKNLTNKLNEKYVIRIEKFLNMLNDDKTKYNDQDNQQIYPSYNLIR